MEVTEPTETEKTEATETEETEATVTRRATKETEDEREFLVRPRFSKSSRFSRERSFCEMSIPFASAFSVALRVTVAFVTVASVTVASLTSTQFFSECGCVAQQKLQQNQPSDSKSPMISIGSTLALHGVMSVNVVDYNPLTRSIIEAAIEVHKNTGAGMLESVYMPCLQFELKVRGLRFLAQHPIPIVYKGQRLDASYRIDLIVEDVVVVELKSVEAITPVHEAQILTYMRLAQCPVGLLMNFNVPRLVDGVKRKVNAKAVVRGDGGNGNRGDGGNGNTQSNEGN